MCFVWLVFLCGSLFKNFLEILNFLQRTSLFQHLHEHYDLSFICALATFPEKSCIIAEL